jgi:eukaryotic-like serine/threonine-protein kinase
MPYERGMACYELGRHLPLQDPDRRVQLTRARETFNQLGATYNIERTQAVSQHLSLGHDQ